MKDKIETILENTYYKTKLKERHREEYFVKQYAVPVEPSNKKEEKEEEER